MITYPACVAPEPGKVAPVKSNCKEDEVAFEISAELAWDETASDKVKMVDAGAEVVL